MKNQQQLHDRAVTALLSLRDDPRRECETCEGILTQVGRDRDGELRGICPEHGRVVAWATGLAQNAADALVVLDPALVTR